MHDQHRGGRRTSAARPAGSGRERDAQWIGRRGRGSATGDWVVEFAAFQVAWPDHFALASSELAGVPFDLIGCGGLVFPQRPNNPVPSDAAELAAPGQRVVAEGDEDGFRWVELHYELDGGDAWLQRHYLLAHNWVITMQEPRRTDPLVVAVADRVAEQMTTQLRS